MWGRVVGTRVSGLWGVLEGGFGSPKLEHRTPLCITWGCPDDERGRAVCWGN